MGSPWSVVGSYHALHPVFSSQSAVKAAIHICLASLFEQKIFTAVTSALQDKWEVGNDFLL